MTTKDEGRSLGRRRRRRGRVAPRSMILLLSALSCSSAVDNDGGAGRRRLPPDWKNDGGEKKEHWKDATATAAAVAAEAGKKDAVVAKVHWKDATSTSTAAVAAEEGKKDAKKVVAKKDHWKDATTTTAAAVVVGAEDLALSVVEGKKDAYVVGKKEHWKDATTTTTTAAAAVVVGAEEPTATLDLGIHHEEAYAKGTDVLPPDDGGEAGGSEKKKAAEAILEDVKETLDDFENEKAKFERERAKFEKEATTKEGRGVGGKPEEPPPPPGVAKGADATTASSKEAEVAEAEAETVDVRTVAPATTTRTPTATKETATTETTTTTKAATTKTTTTTTTKEKEETKEEMSYRETPLSIEGTCHGDRMVCPDGTRVEMDPDRDCRFPECPSEVVDVKVVEATDDDKEEKKPPKGGKKTATTTTAPPKIASCAGICPYLSCPTNHKLFHAKGLCCGSCVLTCDSVDCVTPECKSNERLVLKEGHCCPSCEPTNTCVDRHGKVQFAAVCLEDPCANAICPGHDNAVCVKDTCGGCSAIWYEDETLETRVDCTVGRCSTDVRKCYGESPVTDVCGENVYVKRDPESDDCDFPECPVEVDSRTLEELEETAVFVATADVRCAHVACDVPCCLGGGDPITPEGRCCPVCPEVPRRGRELASSRRKNDDSTIVVPTIDFDDPTVLTTVEILGGLVQDPTTIASIDANGETIYDVTTIDPILDYPPVRTPGDDCSLFTCDQPICPPGINAYVPDGQCCPTCDGVPDCADVMCAMPVCATGERALTRHGDCCPTCGEVNCDSIPCPKPACQEGEIPVVPPGMCCPQCESAKGETCVSPFTDADDDGARLTTVRCSSDPCEDATCHARPEARCVVDDCGGCRPLFLDEDHSPVDCNPLQGCEPDSKMCDDGTIVERDPDDDCRFSPCDDTVVVAPDIAVGDDVGVAVSNSDDPECSYVRCVDVECLSDDALRDVNECCPRCVERFGPQDPLVRHPVFKCDDDVAECADGTLEYRDPLNGCQFKTCPDTFDCSLVHCKINADLDRCLDGSRPTVTEGECCPSCVPPVPDDRRLHKTKENHRHRKPKGPLIVVEPIVVDECDVSDVRCDGNPCVGATCPGHPDAECVEVYCGEACHSVFVVEGVAVECDDDEPSVEAETAGRGKGRNLRG